jgi:hypothetical protein
MLPVGDGPLGSAKITKQTKMMDSSTVRAQSWFGTTSARRREKSVFVFVEHCRSVEEVSRRLPLAIQACHSQAPLENHLRGNCLIASSIAVLIGRDPQGFALAERHLPAAPKRPSTYTKVATRQRNAPVGIECRFRPRRALQLLGLSQHITISAIGALGGTRTPTILLTATSRQRVYQFRHERLGNRRGLCAAPDQRRRCNKSTMEGQGLPAPCFGYRGPQIGLSGAGLPR